LIFFFKKNIPNLSHVNELPIASVEQGTGIANSGIAPLHKHAHLVMWTFLKKVLLPITSEIAVWE